jgi:hypothetical protein
VKTDSLLVSRLEYNLQRPLSSEEQNEVEIWERGRTLGQVVNTEAWEILCATIQAYADDAVEQLLRLRPGDENVTEAHAAAHALTQLCFKFKEDVNNAINMQTPEVVRQGARVSSPVPPESM